jgi:hypothetical protein
MHRERIAYAHDAIIARGGNRVIYPRLDSGVIEGVRFEQPFL